jgi:hypothetical protein
MTPRGLLDRQGFLEEHTASVFSPEDRGCMFLLNVGIYPQVIITHKTNIDTTAVKNSALKMEAVCSSEMLVST